MSNEHVRLPIVSRSSSPLRILRSLAVLASAALLAACGAPNLVGMQGRLTNSSGVPLNGSYTMMVKFYIKNDGTGTAVYTQTRTIDVANGLFSADIGQGVMQPSSDMDPRIFAQPLYAQLIVNSEVLTPLVPVTGAPYALSLTPGAVVAGNFTSAPNFAVLSVMNGSAATGGSPVLMLGIPSAGVVDTPFIKACRNTDLEARGCDDPKFIVNADGTVNADGAYSSPAADFAEWMLVDGDAEAGDVLMISDAQDRAVTRASEAASPRIIGAVSTKPGFIGGQPSDDDGQRRVMVAMVGIVPVKVSAENGAIRRGDLLVSAATPGYAMRAGAQPAVGTVLGKALGSLDSGTGIVEVVLMAR
jgi:hypothetical protein